MKLSLKTPFTFLPLTSLSDLGVNFKDACRRLWRVLVTEGSFGGLTPSKCIHCREFTCVASCIEERSSTPKVSIDIGGKITWLVTPGFALKVMTTLKSLTLLKSTLCLPNTPVSNFQVLKTISKFNDFNDIFRTTCQ